MKLLLASLLLSTAVSGEIKEPQWIGTNLTPNETQTLEFLQEQGITDKMALSVIMGNIKQESSC